MSTYNFNSKEQEFIIRALSKRKIDCQNEFYKKHLVELETLESEIKLDSSNLTPKNRSIIIGCLQETYIYPNENLLNLSEYHLMFRLEELLSKMKSLDIVLKMINKLSKKSERKYPLFADSLKKINGILNSKQILFSTTIDGKVYKTAILIDGKNGIRFELDGWSEPTNFEIEKLDSQHYMKTGTPTEVRSILKDYSNNHELTEMRKCFDKILKRICTQ